MLCVIAGVWRDVLQPHASSVQHGTCKHGLLRCVYRVQLSLDGIRQVTPCMFLATHQQGITHLQCPAAAAAAVCVLLCAAAVCVHMCVCLRLRSSRVCLRTRPSACTVSAPWWTSATDHTCPPPDISRSAGNRQGEGGEGGEGRAATIGQGFTRAAMPSWPCVDRLMACLGDGVRTGG